MRYGLLIAIPKGKKYVQKLRYYKAPNSTAAKNKYYASSTHYNEEGTVVSARKIPTGMKMELVTKKRR